MLIGGEPEQKGEEYPLVRIWPGNRYLKAEQGGNNENRYKIIIAVSDRHLDNPDSELEAMSDSDSILEDILSTLQYMYRDDRVNWLISSDIEPFSDSTNDKVGGFVGTFEAKVPWNANFCEVPSNDFDFPAVGLFAVSIIDEGYSTTTYTSDLIVDGGQA